MSHGRHLSRAYHRKYQGPGTSARGFVSGRYRSHQSLGIEREKVARFSFIMSIPAIFGATILILNDLFETPPASSEIMNLVAGTIIAFVSGYFAIIWLLDIVKKGKLQIFGYYCFAVSVFGLVWYFTR